MHSSPPGSGIILDSVSCYRGLNVTCNVSITISHALNGTIAYVYVSTPSANATSGCGGGSYYPGTFTLSCILPVLAPASGTQYSGHVTLIDGQSRNFTGVL
jgi:hypothetical protein